MTLNHPAGQFMVTFLAVATLFVNGGQTSHAGDIEIDPVFTPVSAYHAEELPTFPGFPYPRLNGINNSGHAAGTNFACPFILSCLSQTFLWDGEALIHTSEEMIAAVPPGFVGAPGVMDMNNADQQVIRMAVPDVGFYHYLWDNGETILISGDPDHDPTDDGPLVPMPPPPGVAWQVNDNGVVVGSVTLRSTPQAFLWNRNDGVTQLIDPPAGFASISARAINNHNHFVGTVGGADIRAFIWKDGAFTILKPLPGHVDSEALRVNDDGYVVGTSREPTAGNQVRHLVIWHEGEIVDSVVLDHPGGLLQFPMDINANRDVVGYYWPTADAFQHFGFRWLSDGGFADLNGMIANMPGLNVWAAEGINDAGQIAIWADHPDFTGGAFILTPIFETPGDLNDDSIVDELDRAIFCAAIGASTGEPAYIAAADLNHDNVIDHVDQQLFNDILPPCAGDVVTSDTFAPPADGVTDGADLAYLLGAWANGPSCADFVSSKTFAPPPDGVVDGADLAFLLGAWGRCE